jgi:4-alpha-glucanotransferase
MTDALLGWLAAAGLSVWQLLPLSPVDRSGSPYTAASAFAGNPLLLSPERLVEDGLLGSDEIAGAPAGDPAHVDFAAVTTWKDALLRHAWEGFRRRGPAELRDELRAFAAEPRHGWLADWELYQALKRAHGGAAWTRWPEPLRRREPAALAQARSELLAETGFHRFAQYLFFRQWSRVRAAAAARRVLLLGDLPIYVAHDSADVWAQPHLFDLDAHGEPRHVAGVPPDYFSPTGQRWGNPLYRWERLREDGYAWWVDRLRGNLELTDLVRIDHFRAFAAYWEVPAHEETALVGRWVRGPGIDLFRALERALGGLPILAEDLGTITPDVDALRAQAGLPGMKVLQFAFDEPHSTHLPHHHAPRSVVYTGTHDNDTTAGWYATASEVTRRRLLDYTGSDGHAVHRDLMRAAFTSPAELAIVPVQDVLGLGSAARMNTPGREGGNWSWRLVPGQLGPVDAAWVRRLAEVGERLAG